MSPDKYSNHLFALILAGGGGTRLWPKSRNKTPKQFLKLFENTTLTQVTVKRFEKMLPMEKIFIVTVSHEYKKEILREIPKFKSENIIVEPARRDTAPAHGIGAAYIHKMDPDAVIITEAADRLVKPVSRYLSTLKAAAKIAYEKHMFVTVGVEPRYPHTGYGHIKRGKKIDQVNRKNFYKVEKFVEKPPLSLAKKYTASGNYYWNAGQFVWRADDILEAIGKYETKIARNMERISKAIGTSEENHVVQKAYKAMPKISIDYAVAEKAKNMVLVVASFFWTDIGDWKEVWENLKKDEVGNVIIDGDEPGGEVINIDTSDALIHMDGRMIAIIDVDNVVVVDTKDALLICSKSRAQNVKQIVNILKDQKRTELL